MLSGWEKDGTGSGSWPMTDLGTVGVELSGSATRVIKMPKHNYFDGS
jgi:hypothetical protein